MAMNTSLVVRRIKKLRKLTGLTQIELAQRAGLGISKVSFIEAGYQSPDAGETRAVESALRAALRQTAHKIRTELERGEKAPLLVASPQADADVSGGA